MSLPHTNTDQTLLVFRRGDDCLYGRADMYVAADSVAIPLLGDLVIDLNTCFC